MSEKKVKKGKIEEARKTKESQDIKEPQTNKEPQEGVDFNSFEYGDVYFQCYRCGHRELLDKGVKDGLQFVLPTTDKHKWRMTCSSCKNTMEIYFKESSEEIVKQRKKEEAEKLALEQAKEKAKQDELKKKDKKKKSSKGSTKSDGGSDGIDTKGKGPAITNDENTK